jgi:SAM-dependent methyltransferase
MWDVAQGRCAPRFWTLLTHLGRRRRAFGGISQDRDRESCGPGGASPRQRDGVDVVVSGLVLNFVPDLRAALAEMARVTAKGGTVAAYLWDYAGKMELMRYFWDAAVALDPGAASMDEGIRFPLCRPEAREALCRRRAEGVDVKPIDIPTRFANFDDYWQPFLGGQEPAPAYAMSFDDTTRASLRDRIRERMPIAANGSISLTARAWATRATVAKYDAQLSAPADTPQAARR